MSIFEQMRGKSPAAPVAAPAAMPSVPAAAPVTPVVPQARAPGAPAVPWYVVGCPACRANPILGVTKTGVVCRICTSRANAAPGSLNGAWYESRIDGGSLVWSVLEAHAETVAALAEANPTIAAFGEDLYSGALPWPGALPAVAASVRVSEPPAAPAAPTVPAPAAPPAAMTAAEAEEAEAAGQSEEAPALPAASPAASPAAAVPAVAPKKRGRPTNAERAARAVAAGVADPAILNPPAALAPAAPAAESPSEPAGLGGRIVVFGARISRGAKGHRQLDGMAVATEVFRALGAHMGADYFSADAFKRRDAIMSAASRLWSGEGLEAPVIVTFPNYNSLSPDYKAVGDALAQDADCVVWGA